MKALVQSPKSKVQGSKGPRVPRFKVQGLPDREFIAGRRMGQMKDVAAAFGRPERTVQKWFYAGEFSATATGMFHWPSVQVEIGLKPELVVPLAAAVPAGGVGRRVIKHRVSGLRVKVSGGRQLA
jgi:hypothetical protein